MAWLTPKATKFEEYFYTEVNNNLRTCLFLEAREARAAVARVPAILKGNAVINLDPMPINSLVSVSVARLGKDFTMFHRAAIRTSEEFSQELSHPCEVPSSLFFSFAKLQAFWKN